MGGRPITSYIAEIGWTVALEIKLYVKRRLKAAGVATEKVLFPRAAARRMQNLPRFGRDPATGALIVTPELGAKLERALAREIRLIKLRLYLRFTYLYLCKFWLQLLSAKLNVVRYFHRHEF